MISLYQSLKLSIKIDNKTRIDPIHYTQYCDSIHVRDHLSSASIIIYLWIAPILIIIGTIGNGVGLLINTRLNNNNRQGGPVTPNQGCGGKGRLNTASFNQIITCKRANYVLSFSFYLSNIINCLFMIIWPFLDTLHNYYRSRLYFTKNWQIYIGHYHLPIFKTFLVFSFLITVLFSLDQFIAVILPYKYKQFCNGTTALWAVVGCFLYSILWCAPLTIWYKIIQVTCYNVVPKFSISSNQSYGGNITKQLTNVQILPLVLYRHVLYEPKVPSHRSLWMSYQIIREFMAKILPFILIVIIQFIVLRKRSKVATSGDSGTYKMSTLKRVRSEIMCDVEPSFASQRMANWRKAISHKSKGVEIESDRIVRGTKLTRSVDSIKVLPNIEEPEPKCRLLMTIEERRKLEARRNFVTVIIFMVQFVLFILPSAIYHIVALVKKDILSAQALSAAWSISYFLEYAYITLNLYLNLIFNKAYRKYVFETFKHWLKKNNS